MNYDGVINTTYTKTINVKGLNLEGPVSLTLSDANGVFGLGTTSISAAQARSGVDVNVTFNTATDGTYTGSILVEAPDVDPVTVTLNGTATKAWYDVSVGKYGLATLYADIALEIPWDTYEDDLIGVYYGYEFSLGDPSGEGEAQSGELRVRRLNNYIPAQTAVIIQGNSGTYRFPKATVAVDPLTTNVLKGSLVDLPVEDVDGTIMVLGMGSSGYIGFYEYTGTYLEANKAYLEIEGAGVKTLGDVKIIVGGGDDATAIGKVFNSDSRTDDSWYTLQGLRLTGEPTQKGIYIHNGKTVLIK